MADYKDERAKINYSNSNVLKINFISTYQEYRVQKHCIKYTVVTKTI